MGVWALVGHDVGSGSVMVFEKEGIGKSSGFRHLFEMNGGRIRILAVVRNRTCGAYVWQEKRGER